MGVNPKPKRTKVLRTAMRAVRTSKQLSNDTQGRVAAALQKIAADDYSLGDFADDVMGQSAAFLDTLTAFWGASTDVPNLYLYTNGPQPSGTVSFVETVRAGQIEKGELVGPVVIQGNPPGPATVHTIAIGDYALTNPDTGQALAANDEVDAVKVTLNNVPAQRGVYRGVLVLQNTSVLAEVVVVRR